MKSKTLKAAVRTVALILVFVFFILYTVYFGEKVIFAKFFLNSDTEFRTPGMADGYIAQGLDYMEERSAFLSCGYMKDKSASRVYVISEESRKELFFVEMKKEDGSDHTGHTGGISYFGNYLYITGGDGCDVFLVSDLFDGDGIITKVGEVGAELDPAYCNVYDGKLYMGSFYYPEGGYNGTELQYVTTPAGDENHAMIMVYELDPETGFAKSDTPTEIYSTTGKVQGMTMLPDGNMMLSTSWGLTASYLYEYDVKNASRGTFELNGKSVPIVYLDSESLVSRVKAPPMAEEIVYFDGKVIIMTESASQKYIFGNLTSGRKIRSYELD
ncbi:MAG: hypothetical protein IKC74_06210 [Clostridia bacterium]|nr:hypothetical protein [Clostridia bacterium]